MDRKKLISLYVDYFKENGHQEIANASLVPENDPTVLFTTAGMHPLVPYLTDQEHPKGKRLVNVQRCIRTGDIEEVGDSYHHTFFEMIGNWSLGDYWKEEAIKLTFFFHTKVLEIPLSRYAVSVFAGNDQTSEDVESIEVWKSLGIDEKRIARTVKDNWWGPAGKTGPCGPNTEMFYWKPNDLEAPATFDPEDSRWVEIGNDVLMQFNKKEDGSFEALPQQNIDFGGGVERTVAVLNGLEDNYEADMWKPIIKNIEELSGKAYDETPENKRSMRVVADHLKAAVFMIHDGVVPGNSEQGYVLRRLIRRAIRYGKGLGMELFTSQVARSVLGIYGDYEIDSKKVCDELDLEENRFMKTLEQGLKIFEKVSSKNSGIDGKTAFLLYQSYGFPLEMTKELAGEKGIDVDERGFLEEQAKHQELSRTATAGKFASGLADHSEETTKLHTATHLLLAALNKVLKREDGKAIEQRGSNITGERARFDFSFDRKLSEEEVKEIEDLVNSWMKSGQEVTRREMSLEEARKLGADGIFEGKYKEADSVSVYLVGDGSISKELCTGPHVESMNEFNGLTFKITKQKSVGSGARRVRVELIKE